VKNHARPNQPPALDRLIDFHRVHELVGSKCQSSRMARTLAKRGLIREVRINERRILYSERSVMEFIAGKESCGIADSSRVPVVNEAVPYEYSSKELSALLKETQEIRRELERTRKLLVGALKAFREGLDAVLLSQ